LKNTGNLDFLLSEFPDTLKYLEDVNSFCFFFVPVLDTIVSNMVTGAGSFLFGKTRGRVLTLLYGHPIESFYLRQIARVASLGLGAVQRELGLLTQAGVISRTVRGRQVYFQANRQNPLFTELKGLVLKTVGAVGIIQKALAPLEKKIEAAFLFGSLANGTPNSGSDVDLMVIGRVSFGEVVATLTPAQEQLMRDVNPVVLPSTEFRQKVTRRDHFLINVLRGPKIFLIGGDHELGRLGKKRLVESSRQQPRRNRRLAGRGRP